MKRKKSKLLRALAIGISLPVFCFNIAGVMDPAATASANEAKDLIIGLNKGTTTAEFVSENLIENYKIVFEGNENLPATLKIPNADAAMETKLKQNSKVSYVEPDRKIKASAIITNDPFFTADFLQEDEQWYLPRIKLPEAWEYGRGIGNVTVAIIDTGIHADHIELNDGRVVAGYNTVSNEIIPTDFNSDDNGHGTAVAGVIGAIPNNGKGIAGVNWSIKLMPVKALEGDGTGAISSVAAGIVWAADNGANIINLSLGGPGFGSDVTLNNAIIYAYNKGAVIVAAAGNDLSDQGINLDTTPVYPICSDAGSNMVIGVAATDFNDRKASFSNFGINCIDIAAPGKKILTTAYLPSEPSNNILIYGSGTSLATPVVSGVAALLKSNNPNLSNVDIRNILLKSTDNIDSVNQNNCLNTSCNGFLGKGRINALSALSPQPVLDGTLVKQAVSGKIYFISGGVKKYVSNFVFTQRNFDLINVVNETNNQLANLPEGPALPPLEGTLIKAQTDPTVYIIHEEVKRPLTYLVFQSRGYSFANVKTLPDSDVNAINTGEWYWPPDGTMVLIKGDPTVFVMHQGVRRPTTYFVFIQRKLSFSRVINVTLDEFSHIPKPIDNFWLPPLDGTLIKSIDSPEVYVIENGAKHALSYEAFTARKYSFAKITTLPKAEMDVIATGSPIIN